MQYRPMEERFWALVDKSGDCWLWLGWKDQYGYGRIGKERSDRKELTHRYSAMLHFPDFDPSMYVLHTCDNPSCVNPDHLFLGDQFANMQDMAAKGRGNAGLTHCRRGHPFDDQNTKRDHRNKRYCYECRKVSWTRSNAKRKVSV